MVSYSSTSPASGSTSSTPSMTPQQRRLSEIRGLKAYREFVCGSQSLPAWLYYELCQLFSDFPGILGYGLRLGLFPHLFDNCGAKPAFGRGVSLRRPAQITLGNKVMLDDHSSLEVRGDQGGIICGDRASIGKFTSVVAKDALIILGAGCNIGSYCRIATQSGLNIGESVLVGAFSYIGAGNHQKSSSDKPLIEQDMDIRGGVKIGSHAWIGAGAMILDGVTIGDRAIVGAQSLVREDVPADSIVVGSPAKLVSKSTLDSQDELSRSRHEK